MALSGDLKKTLFVIDGSSFLYRAYYGVRPLHTSTGEPVQAVYAFCRMIQKLIYTMGIEQLVVAWDSKGKTTRHEMFPDYKATRQDAPTDIFQQKDRIIQFLDHIKVCQIAVSGIEADDIMYSLARDRSAKHEATMLVTTDKDMGQALDAYTTLYDAFKEIVYDVPAFEEKMGFPVERLPLYFALLGDSSDNIPGVKGIGKKTAQELAAEYTSLDEVHANLENLSSKRARTALQENKENAYLSHKLFLLQYYKLDYKEQDLFFDKKQWSNAIPFFRELGFKSLLPHTAQAPAHSAQQSLFGSVQQNGLQEKIDYYKKKYDFKLVTTLSELEYVCAQIEAYKTFALDTECDSLRPLQSALAGISICVKEGEAFYIPCGHKNGQEHLSLDTVKQHLGRYLNEAVYPKILHNTKFDQLVLAAHGIILNGVVFDTMVAASLVTKEWQRVGLKSLSEHYFQEEMISFKEVVSDQGHATFVTVPFEHALYYAANDAHQTLRLAPLLKKELAALGMTDLYETLEHPVIQVLYAMEKEGIFCDQEFLGALGVRVDKELGMLDQTIRALVGDESGSMNFNSPKQMRQLLFEQLGLPPQKKSGGGKDFSTDKEVLVELSHLHPVPAYILKYRELFKLKSTYIDALPNSIDPVDHKIHTTYNQILVATGRLSSADPNLQNIPADSQGFGIEIRAAFKPAAGHVFISADYSQIELRVLAQLSGDPLLQTAFLTGQDIHQETASRLFEVALDAVTHEQRQLGKRINFSILYGLTPYGLSKDLRIPFSDAKRYIEKYFAQYPRVSAWMEDVITQAKADGYVSTHWGRRRYIPAIHESNKNLYQEACRVAVNTVAQGTAAELIKMGMIKVKQLFDDQFPQASLVLQIHDELLISVPEAMAPEVCAQVKHALESVVEWDVPLVATVRTGRDWKEVTK
jgi:DNA polymerase-1